MEIYEIQILIKVLSLVATMAIGGALSAYYFRQMLSCGFLLVSFVVTVALIFVDVFMITPSNNPWIMFPFDLIYGAAWGATLGGFVLAVAASKGKEHVAGKAVMLTFGVMAIATTCAAGIGLLTGFNFQGLNGIMFFGILFLIGISTLGLFMRYNRVTEWAIGVFGSIFWTLYLVIDFNRIVANYNPNSPEWSAAQEVATQLYADLVLLFQYLFPLLIEYID